MGLGGLLLRNIGAGIVGVVVGGVLNMAVLMASTALYPMPAGLDPNDPDALGTWIATLPVTALLLVVLAHLSQAAAGSAVAALIATRPIAVAATLGTLTAFGTAVNLAMMGGPAWMWLELPLDVAVAVGAATLVTRRRQD